MPTYVYCCSACGHEFELSQRITEPPAKTCVKCGKDTAARRICGTSFVLKGGGWYADGYSHRASGASKDTKPAGAGKKGSDKGASGAAGAR